MIKLDDNYRRDNFLDFLQTNFITDFKRDIRTVTTSDSSTIEKAYSLGHSDVLDLQVFEFEFNGSVNKRVTLTKDAFQILKQSATFQALGIFYSSDSSDWRLSLLTANPERTEEGKVSVSYSNPKRYSFFLGPNAKINTPTKFLVSKGPILGLDDLKSRFSVEVVNKEFYKEISELFIKLVGGVLGNGKGTKAYEALLKLPSKLDHSRTNLEFAVRLIGRIIFCWFLREKKSHSGLPLMPKELLSLETVNSSEDYYHKILEPIFFEVLNKPTKSRIDNFSKEPFLSVPYLNGGLFSPQDDDFYKRSNTDLQSQYQNTLKIPDAWFIEFFEVLETYNFTIDENTSYDEELSIDPEMLGRIFENLLAEINPETGESARKSTGSYYTPRVIVDYMVNESLVLYLKGQTAIEEAKLRALISYDLDDDINNPLNEEEKQKIINALEKVKILDPACGSGAFPMGALQKIVFVLQQVDPDGKLWFKKQTAAANPEFRKDIEKKFSNNELDFIRKLGVIRNSIYGVDIQPIATEISRLRCFLTLVVDEIVNDTDENRGIKPLPNLDFKFVTANSLIGLPKIDSPQQLLFDERKNIADLHELMDDFFSTDEQGKYSLMSKFHQIQKDMIKQYFSEKDYATIEQKRILSDLGDWDPFTHKATSWFDPEWMFGVKDGFDIVMANPPYIDSEGMVNNKLEHLREYIVKNYKYTKGNWDIYIAFFEKGFSNLNSGGVLTFISPDKWISKPFGAELRKNKYRTLFSILNAGREVFENAKVDSIVSIFNKEEEVSNLRVLKVINGLATFIRNYDKSNLKPPFALDCVFTQQLNLINKLEKFLTNSSTLNCENACATSDAYKLSPLITDLSVGFDPYHHFKVVNTGTINKWSSKWGFKDMTYLGKKYRSPIVMRNEFLNEFKGTYSLKTTKPKLIIKGLNLLDVCIDINGEVIPGKSTLIVTGFDDKRMKWVMAYLNTPLPIFYLKEKYPASSYNQGTTFTKDMINNLPIPVITTKEEDTVASIVDNLIKLTESKDYLQNNVKLKQVSEFENHINQIVYKLYGLTTDEIKIVEGK